METHIYHYKNSDGNWEPFYLEAEHSFKWQNFCRELSLLRPKNPNPAFGDYLEFFENRIHDEITLIFKPCNI